VTAVHQLSQTDAPRIAVQAQLLDAERPADLIELVRGLTLLQLDPIAALLGFMVQRGEVAVAGRQGRERL
jgi:hypothetical protein